MKPRATLAMRAPRFMALSSASPITRVVWLVEAAARTTQSNSPRRGRQSSGPMTFGSPEAWRRTPVTSTPKGSNRRPISRPIEP